ncbi:hypothetical protein CRUP_008766 [Coryphaenoides rupestris]|nr:hypothetical protein CRUP_008766 [Coryphaenoides rupestris]
MLPKTSKEELIAFITVYQMEAVTEYDGKTAGQILSAPVPSHALLFVRKSSKRFKQIQSAFQGAAHSFRLKVLFVMIDVDESRNGRLLEYFRVREGEAPLIRLPKMTSEPIPEGWDTQPVKQLVGMTLEKVVFNPDTTTFVLLSEQSDDGPRVCEEGDRVERGAAAGSTRAVRSRRGLHP